MTRLPTADQMSPRGSAPSELRLINWPLVDERPQSWLAVAVVAIMGAVMGWSTGNIYLGLVGGGAMAVSLWRQWVPVTFDLGPLGIVQSVFRRRRYIAWSQISRTATHRNGVLFVTVSAVTPLAALHSLFIRWGPHRESMLAIAEHYVAARAEASKPSTHQNSGEPNRHA